jgi:transposase
MNGLGLPSLHALDQSTPLRIWLCTGTSGGTDMRCGFDRLAALAQQVTGQDPLSGHLFVFRGRSGDRLKILYWDRDPGGFVLFYKRLEAGQFKLPRLDADQRSVALKPSELAMLLDGIDLSSVKRSRRYQRPRK